MQKKIWCTVAAVGLIFSVAGKAWAFSGAYNNDVSDARSLALAGAVVATPVSPATNWYNPGGLTQLEGEQVTVVNMVEWIQNEFTTSSGQKINAKNGTFDIPTLFYSKNFDNKWALGMGLNSAYGLSTSWDDDVTRYVTTDIQFQTFNFNPNIAYTINDKVSIAGGIDIVYGLGDLNKKLNQTALNTSLLFSSTGVYSVIPYSDGRFQLEGSNTGIGGNFGLLITPTDRVRVGLSYRSSVDIDLAGKLYLRDLNGMTAAVFGGSEYECEASLKVPVPETIGIGVAWDIFKSTTVELDVEWARWSEVDTLYVKYRGETNPVRLAILNSGNPIPKDWDDTFNVALGVSHKINDTWTIYGGTRYRPTPVPERTFDPAIPSATLMDLEGGFSYNFKNSTIDVCVAYIYGKEREVNNSVGNDVGASIDGKYKLRAYVLGIGYTYRY